MRPESAVSDSVDLGLSALRDWFACWDCSRTGTAAGPRLYSKKRRKNTSQQLLKSVARILRLLCIRGNFFPLEIVKTHRIFNCRIYKVTIVKGTHRDQRNPYMFCC